MVVFTKHLSMGHSYSAAGTASGASDDAHTYPQLINARVGSPTLVRHGRSSAVISANGSVPNGASFTPTSGYAGQDSVIDPFRNAIDSIGPPVTGIGTSRGGLITIANGLNDIRNATSTPVASMVKRYKAMIAKLLEASFYDDNDAGWAWASPSNNAWTAQNQGASVRGSVTSGHYGQILTPAGFPSGAVLVFHTGAFDSTGATRLGGLWSIYVGAGHVLSGVDMKAEANATGGGLFTQGVILYAGAPAGANLLTQMADTIVTAAYWDGFGWINPSQCATVLVFGQPQLTATGATNGGMAAGYNTRIVAMNTALQTMCTEFQAVGIPVHYIDMSAMDSNTSYFETLQFHPNDAGHLLMSNQACLKLASLYPTVGASAVSGAGALVVAGHRNVTGAATLSGSGSSTIAGTRTRFGACSLSGSGSSSVAGFKSVTGAVSLTGVGALSATPGPSTEFGAAVLSGSGSATATGLRTVVGVSSLTGVGSATSSGTRQTFGESTLDGAGEIDVSGDHYVYGEALLIGSGELTASSDTLVIGNVELHGSTDLDATGEVDVYGEVDLSGTGSASIDSKVIVSGAVDLSGSGSCTATGTRTTIGSISLTGSGGGSCAGFRTSETSVSLTGQGTMSVSASGSKVGAVNLSGSGSLVASGTRQEFGSCSLSGSSTLSAGGRRTTFSSATIQGTGVLFGVGSRITYDSVALYGTGQMNATSPTRATYGPYDPEAEYSDSIGVSPRTSTYGGNG